MKKPLKAMLMFIFVVSMIIGGFMIYRQTEVGQIAYHRSGFRATQVTLFKPGTFRGYFTTAGFEWLRWKWTYGRKWSSQRERINDMKKHREALIDLGYFMERDLTLNGELYADYYELAKEYRSAIRRMNLNEADSLVLDDYIYDLSDSPELDGITVLSITASVDDMAKWEQLVRECNEWIAEREVSKEIEEESQTP